MKRNIYAIARKLMEVYRDGDINQMSEKAKNVANNMKFFESRDGNSSIVAELDYFRKRVRSIIRHFENDSKKLQIEHAKMDAQAPNPIFHIFEYDEQEIVDFLKAHIEETEWSAKKDKSKPRANKKNKSNRKANSMSYDKIDIDKKYDFAYEVLKHGILSPEKLDKISKNFDSYYNYVREHIQRSVICDFCNIDLNMPDNKIFGRFEGRLHLVSNLNIEYTVKVNLAWISNATGVKDGRALQDAPFAYVGKFWILWKLWLWSCLQTIQHVLLEKIDFISEPDLDQLRNRINTINDDIDARTPDPLNKGKHIFEGYFMYNFLLMIRDQTIKDAEISYEIFTIKGNEHYKIPEELQFVNKSNTNKKWVQRMGIVSMWQAFEMGEPKCTQETFFERISFCKVFIQKYNGKAGRHLDANDIKTLRAIYRAFFVDKIMYDRKKIYTMAKMLIDNNDYSGMYTYHYIVGNVISSELLEEYYHGDRILEIRNDVMLRIYIIALKVFYKYCPTLGGDQENLLKSVDILENYYIETINAIYDCLYD